MEGTCLEEASSQGAGSAQEAAYPGVASYQTCPVGEVKTYQVGASCQGEASSPEAASSVVLTQVQAVLRVAHFDEVLKRQIRSKRTTLSPDAARPGPGFSPARATPVEGALPCRYSLADFPHIVEKAIPKALGTSKKTNYITKASLPPTASFSFKNCAY